MIHIYSADDHFSFFTDHIDADKHAHIMIQISIALEDSFEVSVGSDKVVSRGILINSKVEHTFDGKNQRHVFFLIDPTSNLGESISANFLNENDYVLFSDDLIEQLQQILGNCKFPITLSDDYLSFSDVFFSKLGVSMKGLKKTNPVVNQILHEIMNESDSVANLETLAEKVSLSKSRLSHLFKSQTGLSLYSLITMTKVRNVVSKVLRGESITSASVSVGFDSPSHFAAVCKNMFGMSLRSFSKDSVYLKVSRY